ncbi:DNA-3-methyladenine glycosylase family protein [Thermosediminibacter oceani]|uniref:DNA-(apurinic or apyrimidinic site) lyase n=1 Tax=Thermosediminibacter oceani (strain ATCC BAA-1034 / DSM 16646 / JW/IW-1228P) TaxID=555079 RepID=D9RYF3_THEOJ|nr:DNA glycosylase [Thermosediminibacter oceani]ADL08377.1 8-oxoguanine DNA glycosylase domain protein [Thermosediminibacter oceani DSM 16646]
MEITFTGIQPFNLEAIAESGQAFRWNRLEDGGYLGVVGNLVIKAYQEEDTLRIFTNGGNDSIGFIRDYFDLERDYREIEDKLSGFDELVPAVKFCSGNRILHQQPWETLISFILSANNSIPNIKRTIERMCSCYGTPVEFEGEIYYTFPTPEVLASLSEAQIRDTRCGFRGKYVIAAARMVAGGDIVLDELEKLPTGEARDYLMKIPGVGRKIADCVLLFSLRKFDAFPVDVWIKRVVEHLYFDGREMPVKKLQEFAENRFGPLAGFAQQYLFHYTRTCWSDIKDTPGSKKD